MNTEITAAADCHVVVFAVPGDPHELAQVLVEVLGMHPTDAIVHARSAPGILPDRLTRERAEQLASAIQRIGVRADVATAGEIPDFHHGEIVHHGNCTDAGLVIIEEHGDLETCVPWNEIELICVGVVPQEAGRHYPTGEMSVLSAARRSPHAPLEIPATAGPELWFIRRSPFRAFRIDHKRMNYEYLGERKSDSATVNFQSFLDDLLRHAPDAYVTPSTRAFLAHGHGPERAFHFDSADQLRRYTQFHLMIRRHALDVPATQP
ncbi:MAG: hypothetical protein HY290_15295 [Planctomycetia bacterium]|nr:hypothetical protein [Planctomycetia bacterium]